jgi:hypothetical protein
MLDDLEMLPLMQFSIEDSLLGPVSALRDVLDFFYCPEMAPWSGQLGLP